MIGATNDNDSFGSVYLFDLTTGQELLKLTGIESEPKAQFGSSVTIKDNVVSAGAQGDSALGPRAGASYVFHINPIPEPPTFMIGMFGSLLFVVRELHRSY